MKLHPVDWLFIVGYCVLTFGIGIYFSKRASKNIGEFFIAGRNLPWWVAGTYLTHPVHDAHLVRFYRRARPGGWWSHVAERCPDIVPDRAAKGWLGWLSGTVCIYTGLFGAGYLCLARTGPGLACLAVSVISGWFMVWQTAANVGRAQPGGTGASERQ
jgi:hypothetical protein